MLKINEIFYSVQGEGTRTGKPCVFIRLTYCNLRCSYCDTEYAFTEGKDYLIAEILSKVKEYDCNLIQVTGGEPLMQDDCITLLKLLCDEGYEVLLETGGSLSIVDVDQRVNIIMDLKCPSSAMEKKNNYSNLNILKQSDELKFVIGDEDDYEWTKSIIKKYNIADKFEILLSVVFNKLEPIRLAEWMLRDKINARLQLQIHKFIWEPDKRGV